MATSHLDLRRSNENVLQNGKIKLGRVPEIAYS
jgi:hypothetical protein